MQNSRIKNRAWFIFLCIRQIGTAISMRFKYTEQAMAEDRKLRQVAKANNEYLRRDPLFPLHAGAFPKSK